MTDAVLCVDIGTSSLKAAYISFKGEVFAFARIEFKKANESNRWLFALKKGIAELNAISSETVLIKAISISGNGPSLANSSGAFLWNESLENLDLRKLPKETVGSIFAPRIFYIREKLGFLLNNPEVYFLCQSFLCTNLQIEPTQFYPTRGSKRPTGAMKS